MYSIKKNWEKCKDCGQKGTMAYSPAAEENYCGNCGADMDIIGKQQQEIADSETN